MTNYFEIEELAEAVLGLTEEQIEEGPDHDELMLEKFDIDMEQFWKVAEALLPFTAPQQAAVSGTYCQGFVNIKESCFIIKQEVKKP